jgi:DNA-directed RNA polymerase specialized sigma24 family protein
MSLRVVANSRRDAVPERKAVEPWVPATQEQMMMSIERRLALLAIRADLGDSPCGVLIKALFDEGCSYKEVAARLGFSHEGFGARRARCLEQMRRMFAARGISKG